MMFNDPEETYSLKEKLVVAALLLVAFLQVKVLKKREVQM